MIESMSESVEMSSNAPTRPEAASHLAGLLPRFEKHWRQQGAPIVERLRPGLTDADIDALMKPTGMRLSAEVHQLYRWHDGAEPHPELWDSGRLFAIGIWTFRPLAELVAWYQQEWLPGRAEMALECDLEPKEIWPDGYFPVFLADEWRTAVLQDRRGDQDSFPRAVAYFDREWNFNSKSAPHVADLAAGDMAVPAGRRPRALEQRRRDLGARRGAALDHLPDGVPLTGRHRWRCNQGGVKERVRKCEVADE